MSLSYRLILPQGVQHPICEGKLIIGFAQTQHDFLVGELAWYIENSISHSADAPKKTKDFYEEGDIRNVAEWESRRYSEFCAEVFEHNLISHSRNTQRVILNPELLELVQKMERWEMDAGLLLKYELSCEEFLQFRGLLRAYAERGAVLDTL